MSKIVTAVVATALTGAVIGGGIIGYQQLNKSDISNTNGNISVQQSNTNTANLNVNAAQPSKKNLLGTWISVDDPQKKYVFTADELMVYENEKLRSNFKYTRPNEQSIEVTNVEKIKVSIEAMVEGDLLTLTQNNQKTKFKRESVAADNSAPVDYQNFKEVKSFKGYSGSVGQVAFSPDGTKLAAQVNEGIWLWNVEDGTEFKKLPESNGFRFIISPDGTKVAGVTVSYAKVWDVANEKVIKEFTYNNIKSIAFSPDGEILAISKIAVIDPILYLWFLKTDEMKELKSGAKNHAVAFSPDGKTLVNAGNNISFRKTENWDGSIYIDYLNEENKGAPIGVTWSVAFSPDNKTLASGNHNGEIILWNAQTGERMKTLARHTTDRVYSVAFSPDGKTLASSNYSEVKLWNVQTGKEINSPFGTDQVSSVAFSPDGKTMASNSSNGIKLWRAE